MRAELGEIEADDQLPDDDDRPAPEEGRAGQAETEEIKSEDAGRRRDVGERDREARVHAKRAFELLRIPESGEVVDVMVARVFGRMSGRRRLLRDAQVFPSLLETDRETFVTGLGRNLSPVGGSVKPAAEEQAKVVVVFRLLGTE